MGTLGLYQNQSVEILLFFFFESKQAAEFHQKSFYLKEGKTKMNWLNKDWQKSFLGDGLDGGHGNKVGGMASFRTSN